MNIQQSRNADSFVLPVVIVVITKGPYKVPVFNLNGPASPMWSEQIDLCPSRVSISLVFVHQQVAVFIEI
jgi:hypothetical protein